MIYDWYKHTYSFVISCKNTVLAPLQPTMEAVTTKGEKSALMSYRDCKDEIAKRGDVMVVIVVEENEENNEPSPIMKPILKVFKDVVPVRYHKGCHP